MVEGRTIDSNKRNPELGFIPTPDLSVAQVQKGEAVGAPSPGPLVVSMKWKHEACGPSGQGEAWGDVGTGTVSGDDGVHVVKGEQWR